ncbi:MAG: hypothetical protein MJY87_03600 [Fibrobacter sp.]|nr:hypothetical protein [Fibrobacter sp.]
MKSKFILSVASFIGLSAGLFCACSDSSSVAGTAEEPNQIAIEDVSSSSVTLNDSEGSSSSSIQIPGQAGNDNEQPSSSSIVVGPVPNISTSSSSMVSSSSSVIPSGSEESSSSITPPGSESDDRPAVVPPSNGEQPKTLDNFVKQYVNDVNTKFDDMVLAYNLVYEKQCGGASDDCEDAAPVYYELTTPGLHKDMNMSHVEMLFPKTIDYLAKTPSVDEYCPFYLLNISPIGMDGGYTPETGFVLANIEGDKLTVIALRSHTCENTNKDRVFGILFRYCGELSSNPKIEYIEPDGIFTMECRPANSIDVSSEWVNKNLLR